MTYKVVFVGAAGHVGYVTGEIAQYPDMAFSAYAPSFEGEDVSRYGQFSAGDVAPRAYDDWRRMLDTEAPDVVVVAGRYDTNGTVALTALRHGCHVISEKPAAFTMDEVASLREEISRSGLLYTMMLAIRYQAPYWTARHVVEQGIIGEPYLITGQKSYRWGDSRPEWYADRDKYGSSMAWVGIHAFDFARWIAGVDYTEVFAYHANLVKKERPGCQDVSTVIASLSNGGSATFNLDFLRPQAASTHGDDRVRIAGSKGVLEVRDEGRRLHVITADRDVPDWPLEEPDHTLFGDFVAALRGEGDLLITSEEALSITEFAIRAAEAADEHRVIGM